MSGLFDGLERMLKERELEIERLQELLRGTGANRYWEERWRDEKTDNARLRADNELLQTDRNKWRKMWGELDADNARLRAALEPKP